MKDESLPLRFEISDLKSQTLHLLYICTFGNIITRIV